VGGESCPDCSLVNFFPSFQSTRNIIE
jgi:hypothetical protein